MGENSANLIAINQIKPAILNLYAAHGHKFAKLKPANHQKFSNSPKFYPFKITSYTVW